MRGAVPEGPVAAPRVSASSETPAFPVWVLHGCGPSSLKTVTLLGIPEEGEGGRQLFITPYCLRKTNRVSASTVRLGQIAAPQTTVEGERVRERQTPYLFIHPSTLPLFNQDWASLAPREK